MTRDTFRVTVCSILFALILIVAIVVNVGGAR